MLKQRIHQFHSGSAVGDAVTNALFYIKQLLSEYSLESDIFVEHRDPRLSNSLKFIEEIEADADDLLIIHHSNGHDIMPLLEGIRCRKILCYHNITPPSFFPLGSTLNHYTTLGYQQLNILRDIVAASFADSDFNARALIQRGFRNVETIPLLQDFAQAKSQPYNEEAYYYEAPRYQLLFVGRVCENKGQIHLIEFMARYADYFEHPVFLNLVGYIGDNDPYAERVLNLIQSYGLADRISVLGHVPQDELYGLYRGADVYVSYSEHEGFGVPLLEAMTFDLPVVALDRGAIRDTLGGSGTLLSSTDSAELASALDLHFRDRNLTRSIIRRQRERLQAFDKRVVSQKFIEFLTLHLPSGLDARFRAEIEDRGEGPVSRLYTIEGPCETSYSLAYVNRSVGVALDDLPDAKADLLPAEGYAGYQIDAQSLENRPLVKRLIRRSDAYFKTRVSIRNMYPLRPAGMMGDYKIGLLYWEDSQIPASLVALINRYLDGILAPSSFGKKVLQNSGVRVPICLMGGGVDIERFRPSRNGSELRRSSPLFTFLHISSGMPRKGVEELVTAYSIAFTAADSVLLVIKSFLHENNVVQDLCEKLIFSKLNAPPVHVIYDDLPDNGIAELFARASAVVLPTRGEGFNLPAAEALAAGVPLITTNYSAHLDFCDEEVCFLIDYKYSLGKSHVNTKTEAVWVKPNVIELAATMKKLRATAGMAVVKAKIEKGIARAGELQWADAAVKVDGFISRLEQGQPVKEGLRVAWVSTWNAKCGIAEYSKALLENLPQDNYEFTIFKNHLENVHTDDFGSIRSWTDRNGSTHDTEQVVIEGRYDIAVIQYNFGFFKIADLAAMVSRFESNGISTHVIFHKTADALIGNDLESIGNHTQAFAAAARLFVHSVDDLNRLKGFGLEQNVVRLPHGAREPVSLDRETLRSFLGIGSFGPVLASYGFLLEDKGIPELIASFGLIKSSHPDALLLLINADFDNGASESEAVRCEALVEALGLTDSVIMVRDFLKDDESMLILQAADLLIFPYQASGESSSAAVRYGISSLRPVAVTPLNVFDNVSDLVVTLKGFSGTEIAEGVLDLLGDVGRQEQLKSKQISWLEQHNWTSVSGLFSNIIIAEYQDRHGVRVEPRISPREKELSLNRRSALGTTADFGELLVDLEPGAFIRMTFQRYLGRKPSEPDLIDHLKILQNGATKEDVLNGIRTSSEALSRQSDAGPTLKAVLALSFDDLNKGDDRTFIAKIYDELLGRPVDPAGMENLINQIQSGVTRRDLVSLLMESDEFLQVDRPIIIH